MDESQGRADRRADSITEDAAALLQSERVYGFDRHGDSWREWNDQPVGGLAALLDYNWTEGAAGGNVREASMLCVPLSTATSADELRNAPGRLQPAPGKKPMPVEPTPSKEVNGQFPPDGSWIA